MFIAIGVYMKYSLGICSLLTLFLVACASQPPKKANAEFSVSGSESTESVGTSPVEINSAEIKEVTSQHSDSDRHQTEDLQVKLKDSSTGKHVIFNDNPESKAKREEISQAITATENDIKKIVAKADPKSKKPTPTVAKVDDKKSEKSPEQDIAAVTNEIDSAITEMSEKVEEKVAKEKTSITKETPTKVDKILPAIDKTEEARLQAEAALKGLAPKNVKTNNLGDRKVGSVPAEKALGWLKNGNKRFVTGKLRSDGQSAKDRLRTAHEQAPHAAIITCSDSRMIPELIFDQKLGEIYSVRVVDLSVALNVQASLDFAINSLGTNLVVLLGSESCGNEQKLEFLYNQLLEKSAILQQAVMNGQIRVVRGFYNLSSGQVEFK